MVFSSSEEEHVKHVAFVLQRLRNNNLFEKASKCVSHASSVEYLGYVVPKNIKALQSFLGYSIFYHCLIKNYSKKITALTSLLKKDSPFIFNEEALGQFQISKETFTNSPILSHFNPSLPNLLETDASDYALGAVLSQVNDSGKHPIAFDSCKLLPDELNYELYDKELLGIFWALKHWRAFLLSLSNSFEVLKDHSYLQYSMSSKALTCCQARWAEFPSEFHFTITYCLGRLGTLPDAFSYLVDQIKKEVLQDKYYKEILKQLARDSPAGKLSTKSQSVQKVGKEELESAIRRLTKYADRNRTITPDFQPGDKVWLASKEIKTTRPTKKLSERWLGPFEVLKKTGSHAFHLKLPQKWRSVQPVFYVSLLEPLKQSAIPNRHRLPPPPVIVEEKEEWEVAQVLDSKLKRGKLWYLVEWIGFSEDPERTTWEPASKLTNSTELSKYFYSFYPDRPGPISSRV
ncbi:hypothetical protein O181_048170 [Austropuccinia psidii MF-1]|uniref:Chromo domain-containing protein n=1 Tax=Austropuccinia psidii MF-1 TaxID=1389203 RepID=A0A9Q3DRH0_9BASI|nr:hypothetical protein [Austropuccinia psidii MF-1]